MFCFVLLASVFPGLACFVLEFEFVWGLCVFCLNIVGR